MTSTFYMVEMMYPASEDRKKFDDFYWNHISMLLTIDGFKSAQRFECTHAARAPFLAIYRVREPGTMTADSYTSKAGRTSVAPEFREKMTNWDRNLVQGEIEHMEVPLKGWLILIDRLSENAPALPQGFKSLKVVGLDATIAERGVMIGESGNPPSVPDTAGWSVRTFRPLHLTRHPA
jgi:hypothetical protein